jgi:hypothetical protein
MNSALFHKNDGIFALFIDMRSWNSDRVKPGHRACTTTPA